MASGGTIEKKDPKQLWDLIRGRAITLLAVAIAFIVLSIAGLFITITVMAAKYGIENPGESHALASLNNPPATTQEVWIKGEEWKQIKTQNPGHTFLKSEFPSDQFRIKLVFLEKGQRVEHIWRTGHGLPNIIIPDNTQEIWITPEDPTNDRLLHLFWWTG
jgi:hypothetical protein